MKQGVKGTRVVKIGSMLGIVICGYLATRFCANKSALECMGFLTTTLGVGGILSVVANLYVKYRLGYRNIPRADMVSLVTSWSLLESVLITGICIL